ncbi:DUF7521 family protein [Haladaptatus salinisoli]|uniref:DUF7521 family protein n=1 Tax=Haladaptatus salinisoli TaxID=2884876 RepID=UPI001D0B035C|nr:hypothetical protein [Haladaptatus salinisoli]
MLLATSSEIWVLTLIRILLVGLAGGFAVVSYLAYRRERARSLLGAIFGFGMISVGLIIELAYEIGVKGSFFLTEAEVVRLQLIEGLFLVVGFVLLFYSISKR